MTQLAVDCQNVSKTYQRPLPFGRGVAALRDVSFGIETGEVFALLGPNRAGKTTLLKILLGLCRPSGGRLRRLGRPLSDRATLARVGYMHENQAFAAYQSATSLLTFYGVAAGMSSTRLRSRVPELLERVGLSDRAHEPIRCFSKGMVQRLALAQAILAGPDLLVLDEPLEGLDLLARQTLHDMILEQRRAGKTVLIVSHALGEIAGVCDRLAVLVEGRLALLSTVSSLVRPSVEGVEVPLDAALRPYYVSGKAH